MAKGIDAARGHGGARYAAGRDADVSGVTAAGETTREATAGQYVVRIFGPFQITDARGRTVKIGRAKECALVAVLCLSPGMRRSRNWLRSLLWSAHDDRRAAANLRQAIWQIRAAFSDGPPLIACDEAAVWLDASAIAAINHADRARLELLEGIDIRDDGFEEWLRDERMVGGAARSDPQPPDRPRLAAAVRAGSARTGSLRAGRADLFIVRPEPLLRLAPHVDAFANALRNSVMALQVYDIREGSVAPEHGMVLTLEHLPDHRIGVSLRDAASGQVWWAQSAAVSDGADAGPMSLVGGCMDALLSRGAGDETGPGAGLAHHLRTVLDGMFVPGTVPLALIHGSLGSVLESESTGLALGLRNGVRMLQYGERIDGFDAIERDSVIADLRLSLEQSPDNPLVLAIAGHTASLFFGDYATALEHSRLATALDPNAPLVATLHALVLLRAGDHDGAAAWSLRACHLASRTRYRGFAVGVRACCLAAQGEHAEALRLTRTARAALPGFRALNKLMFLGHARLGQREQAARIASRIRETEPDFGARLLRTPAPTVGIPALRAAMAATAETMGLA